MAGKRRLTHGDQLVAMLLIGLAVCAALVAFAVHQPWLGLRFALDDREHILVDASNGPSVHVPEGVTLNAISSTLGTLDLVARDILIEPDGNLAAYADYEAFLARQESLSHILSAPQVRLHAHDGRSWQVQPSSRRPPTDLPVVFWIQLGVGLIAWLISSAIWVFRRSERSARYLLLSGASTLVFAPFAGVYGTRELAMPAAPFRLLSDMNFLGGSVFVATLIALLLYYPRRIASPWVGRATLALFVGWFVAQAFDLFGSMIFARRSLVFTGLVATFILAAVQWRRTAVDPVARAALQWFLLSWLVGCSAFSALIFVPQMFGIDTSAMQGYGFLLFVPVYAGLAFGILRYRLFDLGDWWTRTMAWLLSLFLLILLDLLFLLVLQLSPGLSIGLALLLCGLVWLPVRGWLWTRFAARHGGDAQGRFQRLVDVAFRPQVAERNDGWIALLEQEFAPLEMQQLAQDIVSPMMDEDGLALLVPAAGEAPALRLMHPGKGQRLFNHHDAAIATELIGMFDHLVRNRAAFDAGAQTERSRIARDIHDHIGASLLDALHSEKAGRKDRLIRETLVDLRGIVNGVGQAEQPLDQALIQIRREIAERLEAKGLCLEWSASVDSQTLPPPLLHALRSILRETISNAIKHADGTTTRVTLRTETGALEILIEDDGIGFDPHAARHGAGLYNIHDRLEIVGGTMNWLAQEGRFRTRMAIRIPFPIPAPLPTGIVN